MKVFLDVGANTGQSLAAAMAPEFAFDLIVCFEPAAACWPALEKVATGAGLRTRLVAIEYFGLWNWTGEKRIHQPGTQGGGLWRKDKDQRPDSTERCRFVQASVWMRDNIAAGDVVYLKLNCEGAECDILDDLLDSGEFEKVAFVMIDFDVRKIAAMKHRQAEVQARLAPYPFPRVATSKQVMVGDTHQDRIHNWLRLCR